MRCKNCGWINPNDAETCEKCNQPMSSIVSNRPIYENTEPAAEEKEEDKKTVIFKKNNLPGTPERQKMHCPNCGYPVWNDMSICPQCKFPLQQALGNSEEQNDKTNGTDGNSKPDELSMKKTINPYISAKKDEVVKQGPSLTLSVQRGSDGGDSGQPQNQTFFGNEIRLNKQATEVTGKEETQVVITLEDGQWYIEDKGNLKKTFVLAVRKMPIQEGDILLINDRQCQIVKTDKE